jgi:hypothetical protein
MCETYSGWTNRETWAFMLHVNNDEGLQSEARDVVRGHYRRASIALEAWADTLFTRSGYVDEFGGAWPDALADIAEDIGSLYRVNWQECASSILRDVAELDGSDSLA